MVDKPIVAVLELGTKECGYAYAERSSILKLLEEDINASHILKSPCKEPPSILLDPLQKISCFGSEADSSYAELEKGDNHRGWMLLTEVTQFLYGNKVITRQTKITDVFGKTHDAFHLIISLLKHLQGKLLNTLTSGKEVDIQYVITIPGLLNESAKCFVMEAAKEAGLDVVSIAMEKEIAAFWNFRKNRSLQKALKDHDNTFMVLDAEGENVDIAVFTTPVKGQLQRLDSKSERSCGGASVDKLMVEFLSENTDSDASNKEAWANTPGYKELIADFRIHKNNFDGQKPVTFRLPMEFRNKFTMSKYITIIADKVKISTSIVVQWFQVPVQTINKCIRVFLEQTRLMLMTDAFAKCPYVICQIQHVFPNIMIFKSGAFRQEVLNGALISALSGNEKPSPSTQGLPYHVVAAFDIGTTYSGYAYSYVHDPKKVQTKNWYDPFASASLVSRKAPTCVLLNPKGQFDSFGFDAEHKFSSLDSTKEWRLFRNFKMILHAKKTLSRTTTIEDLNGKSHAAMPIFSMTIHYLRQQLLEAVRLQKPDIPEALFQYVLTVPAIWDDNAKLFMREAAVNAGINGKRLKLALEPEVAALWYMTDDEDRNSKAISIGSKYMVIDLGGGTADISIQERFPNEQLRVIQKASGGPWGGTCIDQNFVAYLKSVFGKNEFDRFQQQESGDYFEILNSFETKKRSNLDGRINLRIPMSLYAGKESKKNFFKKSKQIPMERDKLPIDLSIVMSWFDEPTDQLINHIKDTLSKPELRDVRIMMLVGGLAESKYIQTKLINNLPEIQLIVPEDAGLAVLKGAVIFGHTPSLVASRIMAYTYGIGAVELFNRTKHFGREKILKDGNWYAGHCFKIFVHVNEEILSRHRVSHIFVPLNATSRIPVYRTLSVEPKYTTDPGCELLGEINIQNRTDIPLDDQKHNVTFMFGETELLVSVMDPSTGKEEQLTLNCLK